MDARIVTLPIVAIAMILGNLFLVTAPLTIVIAATVTKCALLVEVEAAVTASAVSVRGMLLVTFPVTSLNRSDRLAKLPSHRHASNRGSGKRSVDGTSHNASHNDRSGQNHLFELDGRLCGGYIATVAARERETFRVKLP